MNQNVEKMIAKDLLSISAVFLRPDEPFTWASGIKSPIYCDNRLTLTAPAVRTDVETALKAVIEEYYPDVEVLMGTSTAGIAGTHRRHRIIQHRFCIIQAPESRNDRG